MKYAGTIGFVQVVLLSFAVLLAVPAVSRADFNYPNFQSTAGLNLVGSAFQTNNVARLTPAVTYQNGAMWRQDMQTVGAGFSTTFQFQSTNIGGALDAANKKGCDLTSFIIQRTGNTITDIAPYDPATNPRLRIKFDSYKNAGGGDPSSCFVMVGLNGVILQQSDLESRGIIFRDEAIHQASVIYAQQVLRVLVDNVEVVNLSGIDLAGSGLGSGYVGFASSNSAPYANQDIRSWSFQGVPEPATLLLLGVGGMVLRRRHAG